MIFKDKSQEIIHKGNQSLTVGVVWSIFGIAFCPCPICLVGSVSFLALGIAEKLGLARFIHQKIPKETSHDHCAHDEKKQ